jgi:hypothetical protein
VYSVYQAAKILRIDPSQVRRLLRSGELKGQKWGRDWMVLELNYERQRKIGGGRILARVHASKEVGREG